LCRSPASLSPQYSGFAWTFHDNSAVQKHCEIVRFASKNPSQRSHPSGAHSKRNLSQKPRDFSRVLSRLPALDEKIIQVQCCQTSAQHPCSGSLWQGLSGATSSADGSRAVVSMPKINEKLLTTKHTWRSVRPAMEEEHIALRNLSS
jgi:hypothetical protein